MRDIPIIFSAPMVRSLLDGRKTMTRRLAWQPKPWKEGEFASEQIEEFDVLGCLIVGATDQPFKVYRPSPWQRVKPGDRLWVRENLAAMANWGVWHDAGPVPADGRFLDDIDGRGRDLIERYAPTEATDSARIPSIHMPRWASRLTLVVTKTKIERLQEIDEQDIEREGIYWKNGLWRCPAPTGGDWHATEKAIDCWRWLWTKINGAESWEQNPEVVAITFCVHKTNIDSMKEAA